MKEKEKVRNYARLKTKERELKYHTGQNQNTDHRLKQSITYVRANTTEALRGTKARCIMEPAAA